MDDIRRGGKLLLKRALVDDLAARPEKYLAQIYRVVEGVVPLHDLLAAVVGHSLRKSDGTLHLEMPSELDRKVDYVGDDQAQSSLGAEIRDRTDRVERKPPVTVAVAIELQRLAFVEPVVETGENLVRLGRGENLPARYARQLGDEVSHLFRFFRAHQRVEAPSALVNTAHRDYLLGKLRRLKIDEIPHSRPFF